MQATSVALGEFRGTNFGRVDCDGEGNVYARHYVSSPLAKIARTVPVQKIHADGSLGQHFSITSASPDLISEDFFVRPNGEVFLLGWMNTPEHTGSRIYVVGFDANGAIKSNINIDSERFKPGHLAVFDTGEILLTGRNGDGWHVPYTAVYDSKGKLIKKLNEPEDAELGARAAAGDASLLSQTGSGNLAVDFGTAILGSDGNAYVMRATSPPLILVVAPSGQVVRKFFIDPGDPALKPQPEGLKAAPGRLALMFKSQSTNERVLGIVDLSGNSISTHNLDASARMDCYQPPKMISLQPEADQDGPMKLSVAMVK